MQSTAHRGTSTAERGCATGQPWLPTRLQHAQGNGSCPTVQGQFAATPRAWSQEQVLSLQCLAAQPGRWSDVRGLRHT